MPRHSSVPAYCLHKRLGQAYTTIDGAQVPLGAHGTEKSRQRHDRAIAEWWSAQ